MTRMFFFAFTNLLLFLGSQSVWADQSSEVLDPMTLQPVMQSISSFNQPTMNPKEKDCPIHSASSGTGQTDDGKGLPPAFFVDHRGRTDGLLCSKFIQKDGQYGDYGKMVLEQIKKKPTLMDSQKVGSTPSMQKICPGFKGFSQETKEKFWVWTMAAIAWDESKCISDRVAGDGATGLFQMEPSLRRRSWRGSGCRGSNMKSAPDNVACAVEIMSGQFEGTYGTPGLFPKSYWAKLRSKAKNGDATGRNGAIVTRIKLFKECQQKGQGDSKSLAVR